MIKVHEINITLVNEAGDRLTVVRHSSCQGTPIAHELCRAVEAETNADGFHGRYGPWKIVSHVWQT